MSIFTYYWIKSPWTYVYMLQQVEYNPWKFISWLKSLPNLSRLQKRGHLELTARAKLMLAFSYGIWLLALVSGLVLSLINLSIVPLLLCVLAPIFCVLGLFIVTLLLQKLIVNPGASKEIARAKTKLNAMESQKIAVLGSYGKTTMKELLVTILSQGKKVAATPGNKNVLISHARWVNKHLKGDEEILVFEFGEAEPGDIAKLANFSVPDIAVITGLAPAHLDGYPTLESIADDFATINDLVPAGNTYVQGNTALLKSRVQGSYYSVDGMGEWKATAANVDFSGTSFTLSNGIRTLKLKSGLLGLHQIGPLTAAVDIAVKLRLKDEQIIQGVAGTTSFEHRMQPRHLHGAWIIDDTYNGNIEGMKAGLELLKILPGQKKIYVTPGLVDQGSETVPVHNELGKLIAGASPDRVVLMNNSVMPYIQEGLTKANYTGEISVETNPLEYYTNLEHFLAAGDVVMLQNDWPDSYQ